MLEQNNKGEQNRKGEWPIISFWYTKKKGQTIEHIIDTDLSFFHWAVRTFQNVTPKQAQYYKRKTGKDLPKQFVQDVTPYEWKKGDPESLYMALCESQDLDGTLLRYRGVQMELF